MNRRSFIQSLGVGAVGGALLDVTMARANAASLLRADSAQAARAASAAELIRIGSNENPYGPGPAALRAVHDVVAGANRYPGPVTQALVDAIASKFSVPASHVLLSGGSGDLLRAAVTAFTSPSAALVTGLPSYESPGRTAETIGSAIKALPLTADMRLDLPAMSAAGRGAGLVYVCNPNNPTSTAVTGAAVRELISKVAEGDTFVLVDEAYFEYADLPGFETAVPLALDNPNVIVVRTFSKIHGMAGMRVGYAIAQPATLEQMRRVHSSSGLSVMSLAAATASLLDTAHLERQAALNRQVRASMMQAFTSHGFEVAASDANFVFVNIRRDARAFQEAMRMRGVLVGRPFPPANTWARITVGTADEMAIAMPRMLEVLAA